MLPLAESQSSSDKNWFLSRGLQFTSTVGLQFCSIVVKKCRGFILSHRERQFLFHLIGIKYDYYSEDQEAEALCSISHESAAKMVVSELKEECKKRGIRVYS